MAGKLVVFAIMFGRETVVSTNFFIFFQCSYSYIYFTSVLWPEFTAWDFMIAIFMYQRNVRAFVRYKLPSKRLSSRAEKFVENVQQNRLNSLYTIA